MADGFGRAVSGKGGESWVDPLDHTPPIGDGDGIGRGFQRAALQLQLVVGALALRDVRERADHRDRLALLHHRRFVNLDPKFSPVCG